MLTASIEGRSKKTKELYQYVFDSFTRFRGSPDTGVEGLTTGTTRRYLAHLQDRGLSLTTVSIHLRTLKAFFNALVADGLMGQNPASEIRNPRLPRLYPKAIPEHAIDAVLRACDPVKPRAFQQSIDRLARKAGVTGVKVSPHCWRHTFASRYAMNGGDPFALQNIMGHSSIKTTMRYVHMSGEALRRAHAQASPVDRMLDS